MNIKPILVVPGQIDSIFFEIFFKSLKKIKINSPIIIICNAEIFKINAKKFKSKIDFKIIKFKELSLFLNIKTIYLIDVKFKKNKDKKIQFKNNKEYVINCFDFAFEILKKKYTYKFLNGPLNKKKIFNKNYLGFTEYISNKFKIKNYGMLIYNDVLSVCPLTTHLPIKLVSKRITKKKIVDKVKLIDSFYELNFKKKPKIAITGLNPHCESILDYNEDEKIILPTVEFLKKKNFLVFGPFSADTIFLNQNRKKFDVILGMYHDQVISPFKTIYEYDAINLTLGLPFLRVSPDHGPNENMINKNVSNPTSLIKSLEFLDKN